MKVENGLPTLRCILFVFVSCAVGLGCGSSSAPPVAATQTRPMSGAAQMRAKLNAMSVPDRIAYLKEHPGAAGSAMGVAGMPGAPGTAGRPPMSSAAESGSSGK